MIGIRVKKTHLASVIKSSFLESIIDTIIERKEIFEHNSDDIGWVIVKKCTRSLHLWKIHSEAKCTQLSTRPPTDEDSALVVC